MVFVHLRVCLTLPEVGITEIRGTSKLLPPFKGERLEWVRTSQPELSFLRASPGCPHAWLKMSGLPGYSEYGWVDHRW